jgi:Phosphotransferase enzyme family
MTANIVQPPEWVVEQLRSDYACYDTPVLVHADQSSVWAVPERSILVKIHEPADLWRAHREQADASRAVGSVPVALPYDMTFGDDGRSALWMHREIIIGHASVIQSAAWLRQLHDLTPVDGVEGFPYDLWLPETVTSEVTSRAAEFQHWIDEAYRVLLSLESREQVFVHGEPVRSNILVSSRPTDSGYEPTVIGLDFGRSGRGHRAYDVAMLAVNAVEQGYGTVSEVLNAYGPHAEVSKDVVEQVATAAAVHRLLEAERHGSPSVPARLEALRRDSWFVYPNAR